MRAYLVRALILALVPTLLLAAPSVERQQKLYVLSSAADDLTVIDVATSRVLKTIKVGKLPHGIAAPRSQDVLYVSAEGEDALTIVDPVRDAAIKKLSVLGKRPNEIEVTSDGRYVYVPAMMDGRYEVFDTRQEKVIAWIPTDGTPHNVVRSPDDRYMYFSPHDRGARSAEQAKAGGRPASLNKKIYVVDARTHKLLHTIPTGNTPRPIVISPDGQRLYVNTDELLGFLVLDLPARKVLHTVRYELTEKEKMVRSRSHGIGVTPDGKEVWSTDVNHDLVHVFDVTQNPPRQIARVETGKTPLWLTLTPDGKTVYVANTADDTISVIDAATKKEKTRIHVGKGKAPKRMLVLSVPST